MTTNWRNPAEYPDSETTKPGTWAWEFLRRNPDYRKVWQRYAAQRISLRDETRIDASRIPLAESAFASQFGIRRMADPSCDEPQDLRWKTEGIFVYGEFFDAMDITKGLRSLITPEGNYVLPASPEKAYVEFNLAWPIKEQLKSANRLLGVLHAHFKRKHPEQTVSKRKRESHYRTYLQLLDAEEAGVSKNDMAAALYPHLTNRHPTYNGRKTVENHLVAAKRLRDGGYRFLVGSKPTPA